MNTTHKDDNCKMNCNIPIFFFHCGYADYIEIALRQAIATNPDSEVVLFGNKASPVVSGAKLVMSSDYETTTMAEFRRNYRHMSYQPETLERICFERWLVLAEFIRREGIAKAFVVDTDVMIYADLSKLTRNFAPTIKCGLAESDNEVSDETIEYKPVSGHSSYWTSKAIFEFESLLKRLYIEPELQTLLENRWAEYSLTHIYGGITDMDALGLFRRSLSNTEFINTSIMSGCNGVFDVALCHSEGAVKDQYQMSGLIKRLEWRSGVPYGIECKSCKRIRFFTLHCQGRYKSFMAGLYNGPDFSGRQWLTAKSKYREYLFILERLVKSGVKSFMAKTMPALLRRLRRKGN